MRSLVRLAMLTAALAAVGIAAADDGAAVTLGDPAGIGPEVIVKALADPILRHKARYIIYGMNELLHYAADIAEFDVFWWRDQYNGRLRSYHPAFRRRVC